MSKKLIAALVIGALALTGCDAPSDKAYVSKNISTDADNFKVLRRIILYNAITDNYILEVTGFCSVQAYAEHRQLEVVCKTGKDIYQKHIYGYSDNTPYTLEQMDNNKASPYHYKIVFKPKSILPLQNVEVR